MNIVIHYLIQAILGAAAGYITNDYAINMLFKEYTPLKIGGIIKKTRNEFIENLSTLIEKDIISKDQINEILSNENFISDLENTINTFFENDLYSSMDSIYISEIDDFHETKKKSELFLNHILEINYQNTNALLENISFDAVFKQFPIDNFINLFLNFFKDLFLDSSNTSNIFDNLIISIYENNKDQTLEELLNKLNIDKICTSVINNILDFIDYDNIYNHVYELVESNTENIFFIIKDYMKNKQIKDFINVSIFEKSTKDLFSNFINSDNFTNYFEKFIENAIINLNSCDIFLIDLFQDDIMEQLDTLLMDISPYVITSLNNFVMQNENDINKIIENSFNEVIQETDTVKKTLLKIIKSSFFNNFMKKNNLVKEIQNYLNRFLDPEIIHNEITLKIYKFLKNSKISYITNKLIDIFISNNPSLEKIHKTYTSDIFSSINKNYANEKTKKEDILINPIIYETPEDEISTKYLEDNTTKIHMISSHITKEFLHYINKNYNSIYSVFNDFILNFKINKIFETSIFEKSQYKIIKKANSIINDKIINLISKDFIYEKITTYINTKKISDINFNIYNKNNLSFVNNYSNSCVNDEKILLFSKFIRSNIYNLINDNYDNLFLNITKFLKQKILSLDVNRLLHKLIFSNLNDTLTPDNLNDHKQNDIVATLNEFISEQYKTFVKNNENKKFSLILDNKNSKSFYSKIPNIINTYIKNNLDTIYDGKIKSIVSMNLNKLNDEELVDFAHDFIGKELKPIIVFGGFLGGIAGLILAFFQDPSGLFDFKIANMVTYSLVGYLTSVIAINMIFKPYKENKFLSKIPFLKNFSIGYILKNKKIFAQNTGKYIKDDLLSMESINNLFNSKKENISTSIKNDIYDNDYIFLRNILEKNKEGLKLYICKALNFSYLNTPQLNNFFYKKFNNINIKDLIKNFLNIKNIKKIFSSKKNHLINYIYKLVNNDKIILPDFIIKKIKIYLMEKLSIKLNLDKDFFETEENITNLTSLYNKQYLNLINKPMSKLFTLDKKYFDIIKDKAIHFLSDKDLYKEFYFSYISKLNDNFTINNLILKKYNNLENHNTFYKDQKNDFYENLTNTDLKNDNFTNFKNETTSFIDKKIIILIKNISKRNKINLSKKISYNIKENLNLMEKTVYSLFNGDEIINSLCEKITYNHIPIFIDNKQNSINSLVSEFFKEKIFNIEISTFKNLFNEKNIFNFLDNSILSNQNIILFNSTLENIILNIENCHNNLKLNSLLSIFNLDSLDKTLNHYNKLLSSIYFEFLNSSTKDNISISDKISIIINEIIDNLNSTKKIFKNISKDQIYEVLNNLEDLIFKNNNLNKYISLLSNSFFDSNKNINLDTFVSYSDFTKLFSSFLEETLNNKKNIELIIDIFNSIVDECINNNFDFISKDTKNHISNLIIDTGVDTLSKNLSKILNNIDIDKIVCSQIDKMDGKTIHEMFNSFAGKYFKTLMLYGLGGFVFGINIFTGILLSSIKLVSDKIK